MVTVSSPPPQLSSSSPSPLPGGGDDVDVRRMDGLLDKLKKSMMELIVQGDDVTRQMWHMYSVFEEIFGTTTTSSTAAPLRRVVVGDKLLFRGSPVRRKTPSPPSSPAKASSSSSSSSSSNHADRQPAAKSSSSSSAGVEAGSTTVVAQSASPKVVAVETKISTPERRNSKPMLPDKVPPGVSPPEATPPDRGLCNSSLSSSDRPSDSSSSARSESAAAVVRAAQSPAGSTPRVSASNPLLDTIGALATTSLDSDDSDLDVVYQQLHYRQRRQDQVRARASGSSRRSSTHRHQQVAGSDPESIGYAGSNSIDSGYKSLCATPEVSDSHLSSCPPSSSEQTVIRRSASDVSASDSSTTSRTDPEQGGKGCKIKMGTRSAAGRAPRSSPRHTAVDDVALDHLMYLRQSLRKDAQRSSPSDSITPSGTFREGDLSPKGDWRAYPQQPHPQLYVSPSSDSAFPYSRGRAPGEDQEGGGEGSSDFLLSGVEYYDLESIQEFPPASRNYVTMLEEKTRRFQLVTAPRCVDPLVDRPISSLYRKRSESSQSVDGSHRQHQHHQQHHHHHHLYGPPVPARKARQTDSKLTEAAIRVLEMIEDFRMEEALSRSGRALPPPQHHRYPSSVDPYLLASRPRRSAGRPASTGSLMEVDARSVASCTASAEHHVYEEIAYDLACDRPPPAPPERSRASRSRLLPVPPPQYALPDPRRVVVRSHKRSRSGNLHAAVRRGRGDVDALFDVEWRMDRREHLPPDFPV